MEDKLEFINVDEYRLDIISENSSIIDNLKELLKAIGEKEKTHRFLLQYQWQNKTKIFVSKRKFENYLFYLQDEGFFMIMSNMTGKSVQLTFAGIPVCIDSTLDDNEFYYLVRYITNTNEFKFNDPSIDPAPRP